MSFEDALGDKFDELKREIRRSNVQSATVAAVDQAHMSGAFSTPVQVEFPSGATLWVGVGGFGMLPPVGSQVQVLFNGPEPMLLPRLGTMIEGVLFSKGFPGFGLGGPGFGMDGVTGNAEFNDVVVRGIVNASGGPNLLENGDFEVDISGWTESAGTLSHETDTDETHLASLGALKLVTASESTERFVESDPVDIDPNDTLRLDAFVKGSHALNRSKVAIVWRESDETEIEESEGSYVTVGSAYDRVVAQAAPPAVETGFTDFQPNEDALWTGGHIQGHPTNTAGNRYTNIDDVAIHFTDYVFQFLASSLGATGEHGVRANVGTGAFTGKRITAVEVLADAQRISDPGSKGGQIRLDLDLGGVRYPGAVRQLDPFQTIVRHAQTWTDNPATGAPWTAAEVEAFDTTDHFVVRLVTGDTVRAEVYRYTLRVHWQEDLPVPTKASVRVYLDPEQVAVTTWRVDDVELRTVSSVTAALLRTAESGRRVEIDTIDQPEIRFYDDDGQHHGPHAARAWRSAAFTVVGTGTLIAFDSESYDYGGHLNTSTGIYVAPTPGLYDIRGRLGCDLNNNPETMTLAIFVNSVVRAFGVHLTIRGGTAGDDLAVTVADTLLLAAGDQVQIGTPNVGGNNRTGHPGETSTYMTIRKVLP